MYTYIKCPTVLLVWFGFLKHNRLENTVNGTWGKSVRACVWVKGTMQMQLPPRDKVHRLWPVSYVHCANAPGNSHWRSRCSELEGTSCCRCTGGSLCMASSPARPLTTPLPTSTFVSGHHYSVCTRTTCWLASPVVWMNEVHGFLFLTSNLTVGAVLR